MRTIALVLLSTAIGLVVLGTGALRAAIDDLVGGRRVDSDAFGPGRADVDM